MLITGLLLAIQATKMEELYNVVKMANIPDLFILDEKKVCVRVVLGKTLVSEILEKDPVGGGSLPHCLPSP